MFHQRQTGAIMTLQIHRQSAATIRSKIRQDTHDSQMTGTNTEPEYTGKGLTSRPDVWQELHAKSANCKPLRQNSRFTGKNPAAGAFLRVGCRPGGLLEGLVGFVGGTGPFAGTR